MTAARPEQWQDAWSVIASDEPDLNRVIEACEIILLLCRDQHLCRMAWEVRKQAERDLAARQAMTGAVLAQEGDWRNVLRVAQELTVRDALTCSAAVAGILIMLAVVLAI